LTVARPVFNGYDVDLTYMRQDGIPGSVAQFCQDNYLAGNPDILVTLQETVRNDDGTVDVWTYLNGIIYPTDEGSFKGNEDVSGGFKMFFPYRIQGSQAPQVNVGGGSPSV
jgi:hypothetical protein